jgi:hypothetical protein
MQNSTDWLHRPQEPRSHNNQSGAGRQGGYGTIRRDGASDGVDLGETGRRSAGGGNGQDGLPVLAGSARVTC